jgi:AraC-like DNA-binding protein
MRDENIMSWRPAPHLGGVAQLCASQWKSDLAFYHESTVDFCCFDRIAGSRGPRNFYRKWSHEARPGDVLLFEPGEAHRAEGGPAADFTVLLVPASQLQRAVFELTGTRKEFHFTRPSAPETYRHFRALNRMLGDPEVERAAVQSAYADTIRHVVASECAVGDAEKSQARVVSRTVEYVNDLVNTCPRQHLDLDVVVAASLAAGKYQLVRDFKKRMNVGVYEYYKLKKFALARRLLIEKPTRSITLIADDLGYTVNSFSRSFHELIGVSPRQYRAAFLR